MNQFVTIPIELARLATSNLNDYSEIIIGNKCIPRDGLYMIIDSARVGKVAGALQEAITSSSVSLQNEVKILREFLISLHTAKWTGNDAMFADKLKKLSEFSYARTNYPEGQTLEEYDSLCETTLNNLLK